MSTVERQAHGSLVALLTSVPHLTGAVLATVDGRVVASVLDDHDPDATAAIVASAKGLADRLAEFAGKGTLQELVVRSSSGYIVIYAVGDRGVLTVFTKAAGNLALLHLRARDTTTDLSATLRDIA